MDSRYDDISDNRVSMSIGMEEKQLSVDSADEEVPDECEESVDEADSGTIRDSFIADTAITRRSSTMKEARQRASFAAIRSRPDSPVAYKQHSNNLRYSEKTEFKVGISTKSDEPPVEVWRQI